MIQAFSSLDKTRRRRLGRVDERLRVEISERKPRALNLHHAPVPSPKGVVDIWHLEADGRHLTRSHRLRSRPGIAEFRPHWFPTHQLLVHPGIAFLRID